MQKLEDILRKFPEKKVVVIGDMMIDESTHGHVSKISNEAPTPVVKIDKRVGEVYELGGAANVASNISSLVPVDCVMIFPETSVEKYLSKLKPQIYVKAEDYDLKKMHQNERKAVESYNGKIIFIPIENSISTTKIIEKIKDEK